MRLDAPDPSEPLHGPFLVPLSIKDLRSMASGQPVRVYAADAHGVEQAALDVRLDDESLHLWRRFRL